MRVSTLMTCVMLTLVASAAWAQDRPERSVEIQRMNVYVCPEHPQMKATWPGRCPICGRQMRGGGEQRVMPTRPTNERGMMGSAMQNMPPALRKRHALMMGTHIHIYDPEVLLGATKPLKLSDRQIEILRIIAATARYGAEAVLTEAQRRELEPLKAAKGLPRSMAEMHQMMMSRMSSGGGMMGGRQADPKVGKAGDPPNGAGGGTAGAGTRTRASGGSDPVRDSVRDRYRDAYRDPLRDHYRDQYRDAYRDRLHDMYDRGGIARGRDFGEGDDEGFGDEAFGDGLGGGFGDEGFGGEAFGNEGLGGEAFGDGLGGGFGNEGFGESRFGNGGFGDEGFGEPGFGDQGFGNEGLGEQPGFGDDEGFGRNDEGPGEGARGEDQSRGDMGEGDREGR